jgi:hypothetical protein
MIGTTLLRAPGHGALTTVEIANQLLIELKHFGWFCEGRLYDPKPEEKYDPTLPLVLYEGTRHIPLRAILMTLEEKIGLEIAENTLPFRFDLATWPEGGPLAGYAADYPTLTPSLWVASFFSNWRSIINSKDPNEAEFFRTLRSTLWVTNSKDARAGVQYILDLLDSGQVASALNAARVARCIIIGHSITNSDSELVRRILNGDADRSRQDWLIFYPNIEWLTPVPLSPPMRSVMEELIALPWKRLEHLRKAENLDEWLCRLRQLGATITFVQATIESSLERVPLAAKAILSQLEEVNADIGPLIMCLELRSFGELKAYEERLQQTYRKTGGSSSDQRFRQERLLLPAGPFDSQPSQEWLEMTWRLATPWVLCDTFDQDVAFYPTELSSERSDSAVIQPVPPLEERRAEVGEGLQVSHQLLENGDYIKARTELHNLLKRYGWCVVARWFLSRTYKDEGNNDAALDALVPAVVLRPHEPVLWQSLSELLLIKHSHADAELASLVAEKFGRLR